MMWFPTYIAICVYVLGLCVTKVLSESWADQSLEALDEANDVEIYRAVVSSMNEWQARKKLRNNRNARFKRQDTSVCYPDLGCFESSGPFGYLDMLPNTPEEISTKFLLYPISSRRRRSGSEPIEIPFANITNAMTWSRQNFNSSLPTKILIHGFGSDCSHIWVYEMRSALLTVEDCNVICVDWGNGATLPNYVKASANTRLVGKQLAMFLKGLVDNVGLPLEKMHLVGFSLGAHVAGFAGSELGNLSRITGLDPAGPLFESQDPRARLDQTDAAFVDVIHSNGENLILGGLGSWQPMGHVDFYPNGGRMQKGCTNLFVGALTDIIWSAAVEGRSLCNHRRAYKFFTDSIHPRCHFPAFPCDSYDDFIAGHCFPCNEERKCGNMGYYADRVKGRGQQYLVTRDEEPFCAHQYLIKIESSPAEVPIVSYGRIQVTLIGDTLLNETFTLTKKEDEEMRLGESISKIIVPHPILLPPSHIQVVYTSYTGWLTSGLLQWKIDKISLSDSYGKSVSICKKNLILDSGIPVVLPLFPGDCNLPSTDEEEDKYAEDRFDEKVRSKFVPNIEDKNNSLPATDPVNNIIKSTWSNDKDNAVDNEPESSRAFNTRHVKSATYPENKTDVREVVEPILKPQSTKNARSHNPNKERPEITEPILGPTTSKSVQTTTTKRVVSTRNPTIVADRLSGKEKEYPFYEDRGSDWVPAVILNKKTSEKWKREDDSKSISINHSKPPQRNENGFEAIVRTVQFLPQRIARMFEDAEKYARETILPFVSTYTPRFLSDFITPRERQKQKYVPLHFEEPTTTTKRPTTKKLTTTTTTEKILTRDEESNSVLPEVKPESTTKRRSEISSTTQSTKITGTTMSTTPYTNIQKIFKKNEKVAIVYPENSEQIWSAILSDDAKKKLEESEHVDSQSQRSINSAKRSIPKEIYIDLPVFEDDYKKIKYIPIAEKVRFKRQDTSVCYPDLGCFESSGPFGYLDMLPNTPEEISTKFLLYPISSRRRRSGSEPIEIPFANITNAMTWSRQNFNSSLPTKILIHGFGSDCSHIWVYEMRSALLTVEDCNVICVDWGNGATLPNYVKASANTRLVGKQLAMFLKGLVDNVGLPLEKMHLVGFSLGAHVAGFAGSELGNLSRITGLDPAGPLFESQDPRARLDQTDAAFVDVIHSNGENLILGGLGSWQPMGHVDFYPNGGRMQKGCTNLFVGALTDIIWSAAVEGRSLCNHRRAYKFFTDSIHPRCHFPAFPCDSYDDFIAGHCFPCNEERKCGNMGYYADRVKGRGQQYLVTRDEEPFCAHQYLIKIESSPAEVPIVSYGRIQVTLIGDTLLNETFTLTKKEDEEMRLGESISKIIVPHPILLPPSHIQVVYTSYTGWLTSGLLQWKIDKISLSDSYGKSVSICKKNLILDSGIPVVLPLFPGDCNLPSTDEEEDKYAEDRFDEKVRSKFVPNIEDKNNSLPATDPVNNIIKSTWSNDKDNAVDNEPESSRAFNTRHVKSATYPENKTDVREVVEPILKPQSTKNARSHNPNKERPEITEPILGPTTSKSVQTTTTKRVVSTRNPTIVADRLSGKEKEYPFYEDRGSDWVPAVILNKKTSEKWKREDDSKSISINHSKPPQRNENGFEAIVRTVQFLPQRIARMFEDAEKYARETILPFVSTYTPRFLSDFITPRERQKQKYVPLHFEEPTTTTKRPTTKKLTTTTTTEKILTRDEESNSVLPEVKPESTTKRRSEISSTTQSTKITGTTMSTTPYTNIQKIFKKNEKVAIVYPENSEQIWSAILSDDAKKKLEESEHVDSQSQRSINSAKRSIPKEIYIDLPVFEDDYKKIKYIPIAEKVR